MEFWMVPVQVDMIIKFVVWFENNPGKNMSRISLYELSTYHISVLCSAWNIWISVQFFEICQVAFCDTILDVNE